MSVKLCVVELDRIRSVVSVSPGYVAPSAVGGVGPKGSWQRRDVDGQYIFWPLYQERQCTSMNLWGRLKHVWNRN